MSNHKNAELTPLLDADYLVYGIGFAAEGEPLEYALSTVKHSLQHIWDRFPERKTQRIFLSGKGNFRDKLATIQVYKGNRDPAHRPEFYDEIRQYLIDYHGAEVVQGMEAEDACGIVQYANKDKSTVIVGVDKDLRCIPGFHYNPKKETLDYVDLASANEWFWTQVLMGDRTDNIRGIDGLGPKKAEKLIKPCNKSWERMYNTALEQYKKQHKDDALRCMRETAMLVWILREEGKTFDGSEL